MSSWGRRYVTARVKQRAAERLAEQTPQPPPPTPQETQPQQPPNELHEPASWQPEAPAPQPALPVWLSNAAFSRGHQAGSMRGDFTFVLATRNAQHAQVQITVEAHTNSPVD